MTVKANERSAWLREHAVQVRSTAPDDDDFTDLEPMLEALAGVRIVLLGEPSHGDGATFDAKTRLVRFLHQTLGFSVLAFESGLYDCDHVWRALREGVEVGEAIRLGIHDVWRDSRQARPLLRYLGDRAVSDHPLILSGFDCQVSGEASPRFLVDELGRFLRSPGPGLLDPLEWRAPSSC